MDEADGVWMGEDTRGVQALAQEHRADYRGDLRRALGLSYRHNVGPGPKKSFIFIAILPRFCDISAE